MKSIGKYEVLDEIGSSATGTIYRVRDNFQKQELALKFLHEIPKLDAAAHDQFCREMSLYAELTHRHLAKIVDLGEVEGRIYIATRLLAGADLERYASNNRELPIALKLGILAQACEGLAFAHSRGITHGAMKPANLFIEASNDLTILDFGAANWQSLILAAGGRPEGLIANYFAPEQILGQACDSRSDLFSLALISYEFLAGRYPFLVPASLIPREIVHSEPEPLRKLSPEMPEELEQLLIHGLKKKPEERLQTAEEFASALYRIAQQLRRPSAAPVPAASVAAPALDLSPTPMSDQAQPAPEAGQTSKTPKRGEVQPGTPPAEQPWTARSYASSAGSLGENRTQLPLAPAAAPKPSNTVSAEPSGMPAIAPQPQAGPPAGPPQGLAPQGAAPTARVPPAPVPQAAARLASAPAPVTPPARSPNRNVRRAAAPKSIDRRIIVIAAGAVLAIYLVLSFISNQGLHAKQTTTAHPAASRRAVAPPPGANSDSAVAPVESTPSVEAHAEPAAASTSQTPKPPPGLDPAARRDIKALWEAGRYADAMVVVDEALEKNPANSEARGWKKRIRASQQAEAAIK